MTIDELIKAVEQFAQTIARNLDVDYMASLINLNPMLSRREKRKLIKKLRRETE